MGGRDAGFPRALEDAPSVISQQDGVDSRFGEPLPRVRGVLFGGGIGGAEYGDEFRIVRHSFSISRYNYGGTENYGTRRYRDYPWMVFSRRGSGSRYLASLCSA